MSDDLSFEVEYTPPVDGTYPALFTIEGYCWNDDDDDNEKQLVASVEIPFLIALDEPFGSLGFQSDMVSLDCAIAANFLIENHSHFADRGFFVIENWKMEEGRQLIDVLSCIFAFCKIVRQPPFSGNHMLIYCGDTSNGLAALLREANEPGWNTCIHTAPVHGDFEMAWVMPPTTAP